MSKNHQFLLVRTNPKEVCLSELEPETSFLFIKELNLELDSRIYLHVEPEPKLRMHSLKELSMGIAGLTCGQPAINHSWLPVFFIPIYFSELKPEVFFLVRVKNCPTAVSIHDGGAENPEGSEARPSMCVKGSNCLIRFLLFLLKKRFLNPGRPNWQPGGGPSAFQKFLWHLRGGEHPQNTLRRNLGGSIQTRGRNYQREERRGSWMSIHP